MPNVELNIAEGGCRRSEKELANTKSVLAARDQRYCSSIGEIRDDQGVVDTAIPLRACLGSLFGENGDSVRPHLPAPTTLLLGLLPLWHRRMASLAYEERIDGA